MAENVYLLVSMQKESELNLKVQMHFTPNDMLDAVARLAFEFFQPLMTNHHMQTSDLKIAENGVQEVLRKVTFEIGEVPFYGMLLAMVANGARDIPGLKTNVTQNGLQTNFYSFITQEQYVTVCEAENFQKLLNEVEDQHLQKERELEKSVF